MAQTQQQTPKQNDLNPKPNGQQKTQEQKAANDAAKAKEASTTGEMDQLFEKYRSKIEAVAQSHVNPDRLFRVAMLVRGRSELLGKCTADSFFRCLADCAELGLEPSGAVGGVHLVPRWNKHIAKYEATIVVDYRAMVELSVRSGHISNVEAGAVYANDGFRFRRGLNPLLDHEPLLTGKRGEMVGAWAVVVYKDGSKTFEVMRMDEIEAIRDRNSQWEKGPWGTDPVPMGLKTVVKKALKLTPKSKELAKAIAADDEGEVVEGAVVQRALPAATTIEVDLTSKSRTESVAEKVKARTMPIVDVKEGETADDALKRAEAPTEKKESTPAAEVTKFEAKKPEQKDLPMSHPDAEPPADADLPGAKPKDPWD